MLEFINKKTGKRLFVRDEEASYSMRYNSQNDDVFTRKSKNKSVITLFIILMIVVIGACVAWSIGWEEKTRVSNVWDGGLVEVNDEFYYESAWGWKTSPHRIVKRPPSINQTMAREILAMVKEAYLKPKVYHYDDGWAVAIESWQEPSPDYFLGTRAAIVDPD